LKPGHPPGFLSLPPAPGERSHGRLPGCSLRRAICLSGALLCEQCINETQNAPRAIDAADRGFADDVTGASANQQGAEFRLLADRELIAGRLFGALNFDYEPVQTWLRNSGEPFRDSTLGIGAALAMQVMPNVFIGAEARSLHHYEGLGLNSFAGQSFYIGPTLYPTFGQGYFLSAAWNVQVWGAAAGSSGALDLVNFERHQAKLCLGVSF
jgi:hypothetical protein